MKEEVTYIAKRYNRGKFSVEKGWKRLNIRPTFKYTGLKIAAAISSVVVLSAAAAIIYRQYEVKDSPQKSVQETAQPSASLMVVKVIDFENTPLPTVISKIKEVYGVEVVNVPDNAREYHLSLHYEGNAVDLVATINEILETQMSVKR
jgi:hypothetical protein